MDRVILAHLYSCGSFFTTKVLYTSWNRHDLISFHGLLYGQLAYFATLAILCRNDPELRGALWTFLKLLQNHAWQRVFGPPKGKDKAVKKMRRPRKRDDGTQKLVPGVLTESSLLD